MVIQFAGGRGLWAAERLGPDRIRVSRPGYIGEMALAAVGAEFLCSSNFISIAEEHGWFDPAQSKTFNVNAIYGDGRLRWDGVAWVEQQLREKAGQSSRITFADIVELLRTTKITGDTAGYGQIVPIHGRRDPDLRSMWHAPVGACAAPLVPVYLGMENVPAEFGKHRYLTHGEAERFVDGRHPEQLSSVPRAVEAARSAVEVYKRLLYIILEHPTPLVDEVRGHLDGIRARASATIC